MNEWTTERHEKAKEMLRFAHLVWVGNAMGELQGAVAEIEWLQAEAAWTAVDDALPERTYSDGKPVDVLVASDDGMWGRGCYMLGAWYYQGSEGIRPAPWVRHWRYVTPPNKEES